MATKQVFLNWNSQEQFVARDKDGNALPINGAGRIGASTLLVMALIGCASYDVVEILNKQRQELSEFNVAARAEQDDNPPWKYLKIHIHYQAVGKGIDAEKVKKAILLSEEKYCSVYATLKDTVEITHEVETLEA